MYLALIVIFLNPLLTDAKIPAISQTSTTKSWFLTQNLTIANYRNSIALINTNFSDAVDFLALNSPSELSHGHPVEVFNGPMKHSCQKCCKIEYALIFIERFENLIMVTEEFFRQPEIWFSYVKIKFFVFDRYANITETSINRSVRTLWNSLKVLDFIIVFESNLEEAYSYDPFQDMLTQIKNTEIVQIFPNKLKDLKGYKIKINVLISSPSEGEYRDQKCTRGFICNMLNCFLKYLNANFEDPKIEGDVKMLYKNSKDAIFNGLLDISLGTHWVTEDVIMCSSYPIKESFIVGIVPKAKQWSMIISLVHSFDSYVWALIICIKVVFVSMETEPFENLRSWDGMKILLLCAYFFSIIFESVIQGVAITALTTPKFEKDLDTLDDLANSGLVVNGEQDWMKMISNVRAPKKHMSYVDVAENLWSLQTFDKVYLAPDFWAELQLLNRTNEGSFYSKYYHIPKEPLGKGKLAYFLRKNSPFRLVFNKVLMLMSDQGLHYEFGKRKFIFKNEREVKKLTLNNFYAAFLPLVLGFVLASSVFIVEISGQSRSARNC